MSNQAQFGRNKYHQSRLRVVSRDEVTQPAVLDLPTEDADKVTEAVEPVVDAEVETVVDAEVEPVVDAEVETVVDAEVETVVDAEVETVVDAEVETVVDADNTKKVETSKSASSRSEGGNE